MTIVFLVFSVGVGFAAASLVEFGGRRVNARALLGVRWGLIEMTGSLVAVQITGLVAIEVNGLGVSQLFTATAVDTAMFAIIAILALRTGWGRLVLLGFLGVCVFVGALCATQAALQYN